MTFTPSLQSRLEHQHETIGELTQDLSLSSLKQRVNPEKWSAFENIVHLVSYQPIFIERLELILQGDKPQFPRYVAENDPKFHEYLLKSREELFQILYADRSFIIRRLNGLNEKAISYVARHPKFGWQPLTGWVEFFLLHESHHLFTIFQLICTIRQAEQ
ncbi:MAG: DinB family protein [Bacteroidetes bacterium]|nr:MAG: DinB family protein [Bacteroidota bacterium]